MATWAKGVDFKNSANTARVGGVGIYGTDGTVEKAYLGIGTEPWNNTGLEVTSSAISFKGNKVYHAGDKPTPSEIGAAASSHGTHVTWATTAPKANGTAAVGTVARVAREDHVHPLQTTVSGNAGSATKLATARTINGTSFDGTANITTTQWGTARNISVADSDATNTGTAVSVNGSGNVTLKLPATIKATLTGNASTATTLATARTINGTSFNGSGNITTANWGTARNITIGSTTKSVNGSGNVAWTLSEIGAAAASHTHSYLPLSGGNVTGRLNVGGRCILPPVYNYEKGILINICAAAGQTMVAIHVTGNSYGAGVPINSLFNFYDYTTDGGIINASGIHHGYNIGNMTVYRNNGRLYAWIKQPASYQTYNIEIITNGKTIDASLSDAAVHSSGNTNSITITPSQASLNGHTHNYAGSSSAGGNANAAVKLATARTINGTSFDGTANITTSLWGTARNITIGSTKKSVNGSADVAWSLSEIGAAAASHSHSYLPLSGGTITSSEFSPLKITRSGNTYAASIGFYNSNGVLGFIGMTGTKDGGLMRWSSDTTTSSSGTSYTILDTGNYKTHVTPANIGAATSSHTHNYAGSSSAGGAATTALACTGNSATATKLATARTISLGGIVKGSASFDGSGNITISAAANDITTITKSLTVTTSWIDTGITGTNLATGTYAVQMLVNDGTNTSQYQEYYSGIMSWFADTTNSTDADEILLHKAGHAPNGRHTYLRTIRTGSSGRLKLQISATHAFTAASSITFKFKKLI